MELYLMNKNFERYGIVTEADSIIWHKKYYEPGDFEIYAVATPENVTNFQIGNYVFREDDDALGIIEDIKIEQDETREIDMMIVTGRFSESIYDRRIVWQQTSIKTKSVTRILRTLVNKNFVKPESTARKMKDVLLPTNFEEFNQTEYLNVQFTGDNILEVIQDMCRSYGLGFKNEIINNKFYFTIYQGIDRSYAQKENTYVVFSDEYDNLIKSDYTRLTSNLKNIALVAGEGEGTKRKTVVVSANNDSGYATDIDRREIFVDERNSSSDEGKMSRKEYNKMLTESGKNALAEYTISEVFTGEVRIDERYTYKVDVDLGDICTIENTQWGIHINSRVVGVIETEDENGYNIVFEFGS